VKEETDQINVMCNITAVMNISGRPGMKANIFKSLICMTGQFRGVHVNGREQRGQE
jgi:hypothetical protein